MIKVNIKRFIYDRVWFGYMRAAKWNLYANNSKGGWVEKWVKL